MMKKTLSNSPLVGESIMKAMLLLFAMSVCALASAQSTLSYDLRIAGEKIALLDTFPQPYATEKINVQYADGQYLPLSSLLSTEESEGVAPDSIDFIVSPAGYAVAADAFDSIYSFTTEEGTFTLWQSNREVKNTQLRVKRDNAYLAFVQYIQENTKAASHATAIIGFVCAALLLIAGIAYALMTIRRKKKERGMTAVQRETLRRRRESDRRHWFSQSYLWLLLLVLYAPIILIFIYSFTESKVLGNWTGFSFQLYANLFTGKGGEALNNAILSTVIIALIAAVCSTILGTLAAIGIFNMRSRQRKAVNFLNSIPMINPDIITGISLFLLFVALGVSQGLTTVCIAHIVFCTPYVVLNVMPRLSRMNPNTYEAALDLGATPFQALRKVLLPELWPGMLAGFILALTLSVDDFGVTFFTKGSGGLETLSTFIYSDARKGGLTPELRPLFSLILLVMLTGMIVMNVRADKKARRNGNI